jgi:hypothetical protein
MATSTTVLEGNTTLSSSMHHTVIGGNIGGSHLGLSSRNTAAVEVTGELQGIRRAQAPNSLTVGDFATIQRPNSEHVTDFNTVGQVGQGQQTVDVGV